MSSTKCITCGIGFFSPTDSKQCSKCAGKESQEVSSDHGSCGCGHSH